MLVVAALSVSGCGVIYTVVNSESRLDRLSVPMTKNQVLAEIGTPDRVLRDDGRVLIWEYSLTASRQWLYELALCPVSVWVGGCLFYPFTNTALERYREYPFHVVLVNERLCAWGSPLIILRQRKACTSPGAVPGSTPGAEPIVTGVGPIDAESIERYRTMAVLTFEDAPGVTGSGSRVAGIVTTLLLDLDLSLVERTRLEQVLNEQVTLLTYGDDADALKIGRLAGANAIVIGEVQQWESDRRQGTSSVSLSLRMIDVETGRLLFNGEGHGSDATGDEPENMVRKIAHRILARFGVKTGLLGSGRIGVNWELRESAGSRYYLVREIKSGSPAEQSGLKVGDAVLSCNGSPIAAVKHEREAKRLCRVEAGQTLALEVKRGNEYLLIEATAERRAGL